MLRFGIFCLFVSWGSGWQGKAGLLPHILSRALHTKLRALQWYAKASNVNTKYIRDWFFFLAAFQTLGDASNIFIL